MEQSQANQHTPFLGHESMGPLCLQRCCEGSHWPFHPSSLPSRGCPE